MDFGQAIRSLRVNHGMTQEQLAAECGVSDSIISYWETGKAFPPKDTVERICRAIGVPVAFFLMASIEECDFPESKRILYRTQLDPLRNELLDKNDSNESVKSV